MKRGGLLGLAFAALFSLNVNSQTITGEYLVPRVCYLTVSEESANLGGNEERTFFLGKASEQYSVNPKKLPGDLRRKLGKNAENVRMVVKYSSGNEDPLETLIYFDQREKPLLIGLPEMYASLLSINDNPQAISIKTLKRGEDGKFDLLFNGFKKSK